ncbi:MAG: sulfur oxidation c-type cytochrome SoxX [Gammaproteobacteria bacterium]|nr:sulfur oxidation c-type cytochrome SoxX [Gammaproteobacteria bacterium]
MSVYLALSQNVLADSYCQWDLAKENNFPAIEKPLCDLKGDAQRGKKIAIDRGLGNCLACHAMPIPEEDFHGQIGPALYDVAKRYSEAQLRARMVDAKLVNPQSIMPGFYQHPDKHHRLAFRYEGKTFLSAQHIEDIIAYLLTLKGQQ